MSISSADDHVFGADKNDDFFPCIIKEAALQGGFF
jgi:hypothetical protein